MNQNPTGAGWCSNTRRTMVKNHSTRGQTKSRILLVDDHSILRQGLAELINLEQDFCVCGTAASFHEALEQMALKPDLMIVDISLKGGNDGIELLKHIKARFPKTLVLILSMHDETLYAVRALRAGAAGYVMKQEATEKVLTAIRQVLKGEVYLSEQMQKRLIQMAGGRGIRARAPVSGAIRVVQVHLREKFTLPANQRDCDGEIPSWGATAVNGSSVG
ncbi:MAG: response regulator transcription factor [Verrucomicrobia bacterium]|nr:response regulator transcription factor [Verrucomicrobiota bacterium]